MSLYWSLSCGDGAGTALPAAAHFWLGTLHRPGTAVAVNALTIPALMGAIRTLPSLAVPQRAVLLIPLATHPLIYYVVAHMCRYRVKLDWMILLFAGAEAWHWVGKVGIRRRAAIPEPSSESSV